MEILDNPKYFMCPAFEDVMMHFTYYNIDLEATVRATFALDLSVHGLAFSK